MGRRVALAVHPGSGQGAAARLAGTVAARLRAEVDRLDLLVAETPGDFRARVRRSREAGMDALVVLGGDGAAHQAVQCCAGTGVALGLVPSGTGNDFARALGVPARPQAALEAVVTALRTGTRRTLDLGRAEITAGGHGSVPGGGEPEAVWFATVLCCGFDAAVNARANRMRWPAGPRRYDLAVVAEWVRWRARRMVVEADSGRWELDATLVAVGNTAFYGGGVPICPSARPDDGVFDLTVVGRASRWQLARMLPGLRTGRHEHHPAVRTLRARRVRLSGGPGPVFADGEPLGGLPCTVTCVPEALRVLA